MVNGGGGLSSNTISTHMHKKILQKTGLFSVYQRRKKRIFITSRVNRLHTSVRYVFKAAREPHAGGKVGLRKMKNEKGQPPMPFGQNGQQPPKVSTKGMNENGQFKEFRQID